MRKKTYWQDWTLLVAALWIAAVAVMSGCGSTPKSRPRALVFTAAWCPYCPTQFEIEVLAREFPGVDVKTIDVDDRPDLRAEYHITSVPRYFLCGDFGCYTTKSIDELREWLRDL